MLRMSANICHVLSPNTNVVSCFVKERVRRNNNKEVKLSRKAHFADLA